MTAVTETGPLAGKDAERAAELVLLTATRLSDVDFVAGTAGRADNVDPIYGASLWEPMALSHGHPGIALLYGELARYDARWMTGAHTHLRAAMQAMSAHPSNGLYYGPAAVAAATQTCAGSGGHYAGLRKRLLEWVAQDQLKRIAEWESRREPGVGWAAYDVVNGLSGTGRLLLDAVEDPAEKSAVAGEALDATLRHLVRLTEPIEVYGYRVPGWWIPPELEPVDQDRRDFPQGDFNLGLAHGAPGPLSLLCLAAERGHLVPGLPDAVRRIGEWLSGWVMADTAGPYWPARVSWEQQTTGELPPPEFTRSAWCYGAPGVAAALYRAGTLLEMPDWQEVSVRALHAVLARDESVWRLDGPTVCHGYAGLLQVFHRVGTAAGDPALLAGARRLARSVLRFADEDAPFVFRHLVPDHPDGWRAATRHRALDVAGMLEGAAGTACALLPLIPAHLLGPESGAGARAWDRALMLT
jgi:hypothetical protein